MPDIPDPSSNAAAPGPGPVVSSASGTIRVLVAEDNLICQMVAVRMLKQLGYETATAGNGLDVLQALENGRFDLVLMDVQMPKMDGLTAARAIREREAGSGGHVPILGCSVNAIHGSRERCLEAGMDELVAKPFRAADLDAMIKRQLNPSAAPPAPPPNPGEDTVFDRSEIMRRLNGDEAYVAEVITMFLRDTPAQIGLLKSDCAAGQLERVERQAHSLKGASAMLGARALKTAAQRLEMSAKGNDLALATSLVDLVEVEFQRVKAVVTAAGLPQASSLPIVPSVLTF